MILIYCKTNTCCNDCLKIEQILSVQLSSYFTNVNPSTIYQNKKVSVLAFWHAHTSVGGSPSLQHCVCCSPSLLWKIDTNFIKIKHYISMTWHGRFRKTIWYSFRHNFLTERNKCFVWPLPSASASSSSSLAISWVDPILGGPEAAHVTSQSQRSSHCDRPIRAGQWFS